MVEKRSCENCGNTRCANSVIAFFWDECVSSNFQKYWRPKDRRPEATGERPKPCPFCGTALPLIKKTTRYPRSGEHEGEAVQAFTVVCRNPDCVIYEAGNDYSLSEEEAIARWNNRAGEKNITGKWIIDECDTTDETPSRAWIEFHCPKCDTDYGLEEGQYGWYAGKQIPYKFCPLCGERLKTENCEAYE